MLTINIKFRKRRGFGLLEVLLASVVIVIILGALVFVARNALANTAYLKQRSQATFLAQECVEKVRQIRDSNYIDQSNKTNWKEMVGSIPDASKPVSVNEGGSPTNYFFHWIGADSRYRLTDDSSFQNIEVGGTDYSREINFINIRPNQLLSTPPVDGVRADNTSILADDAVKVKVRVSWGENKSVEIEEVMTNSRQGY